MSASTMRCWRRARRTWWSSAPGASAARRGGDIPAAVARLQAQRPCERIWLETSGLADPAPILQTLIAANGLEAGGLAATVDAVNGAETLARYPEAVKQAVLADLLIVTKRDPRPGRRSGGPAAQAQSGARRSSRRASARSTPDAC